MHQTTEDDTTTHQQLGQPAEILKVRQQKTCRFIFLFSLIVLNKSDTFILLFYFVNRVKF